MFACKLDVIVADHCQEGNQSVCDTEPVFRKSFLLINFLPSLPNVYNKGKKVIRCPVMVIQNLQTFTKGMTVSGRNVW